MNRKQFTILCFVYNRNTVPIPYTVSFNIDDSIEDIINRTIDNSPFSKYSLRSKIIKYVLSELEKRKELKKVGLRKHAIFMTVDELNILTQW